MADPFNSKPPSLLMRQGAKVNQPWGQGEKVWSQAQVPPLLLRNKATNTNLAPAPQREAHSRTPMGIAGLPVTFPKALAWSRAPQGLNESGLAASLRAVPGTILGPAYDMGQRHGKAIDGAVMEAFATPMQRITATRGQHPADKLFFSGIVGQESSGKQFDAQGNTLMGRRADGSIPKSGAAFSISQMQLPTAKATATAHGIPWSQEAFMRDKDYALNLGMLHNRDNWQKVGGDPARAASMYHDGEGGHMAAYKKGGPQGWVQHLGPEGRAYVPGVLGRLGQRAEQVAGNWGAPAPDGSALLQGAFGTAANFAQQEYNAAIKPTVATFSESAQPGLPQMADMVAPDFSAGDAAFEATAPKQPFDTEKEKSAVLRQGFFKGIADAMMSVSGGRPVGFGELLMKMGAGAMSGRIAGAEKIEARQQQFDQEMAQYNRALASRNDQKAAQMATTINANVEQDYSTLR